MPITLDCPRCKQSLAIPSKKAGSYVSCPRCNGRFWVPEDAPKDSGKASVAVPPGMAVPPTASQAALPPGSAAGPGPSGPLVNPAGGRTSMDWPASAPLLAVPPTPPPVPSAVPPPAPPAAHASKKVARFISTEASTSTLKLAEDGKLPELRLQEASATEAKKASSGMNPLVLAGLLAMSVALSIGLVFIDHQPQGQSLTEEKKHAWYEIEEKYFSHLDAAAPLQPYQVYLREARQAASRGDRRTEMDRYRKVLDLLRAERGGHERGLTGSRERDAKLQRHIITLMRED